MLCSGEHPGTLAEPALCVINEFWKIFIGRLSQAGGQIIHGLSQCAVRSYTECVACASVAAGVEKNLPPLNQLRANCLKLSITSQRRPSFQTYAIIPYT